MGMGYTGACADVVEQRFVQEQCPDELNALMKFLASINISMEQFAEDWEQGNLGGNEKDIDNLQKLMGNLCNTFEGKTGLTLWIGYHDQENQGDRYDEVSGVIWTVDNVYQKTEAGKKWAKEITHAHWVMFG